VLETGLPIDLLDSICLSLARAAEEAGVTVIAGDTKVIEGRGEGGGLIINTTGIGALEPKLCAPSPSGIRAGDAIIVSGNLGDHHAAILSARMGIQNSIRSDCALLTPIVSSLKDAGVHVHAMRDVTRGGLGAVLNELAVASGVSITLEEDRIPVGGEVRAFCGVMGLDPMYMGNEGKMVLAVASEDAERTLGLMKATAIGSEAAVVGEAVAAGKARDNEKTLDIRTPLTMKTRIGGLVRIDAPYGEGLPRIC
jgi:hydrogenase expression/formation protein HypE